MGGTSCCLCNSCSLQGASAGRVTFHRARTVRKRSRWMQACREARVVVTKKKHLVICSLHFRDEDILVDPRGKQCLSEEAVPSLFHQIKGVIFHSPHEKTIEEEEPKNFDEGSQGKLTQNGDDKEIEGLLADEMGAVQIINDHQLQLYEKNSPLIQSPATKMPRLFSPLPSPDKRSPIDQEAVHGQMNAAFQLAPRRLDFESYETPLGNGENLTVISSTDTEDEEDSNSSDDEQPADHLFDSPSPTRSGLKKEKLRLLNKNRNLLLTLHDKSFSVLRFVEDAKSIEFYTGFISYGVLYSFYQFFKEDAENMNYLGSRYRDKDADKSLPNRPRTLTKLDEMFLTLIRLRKGYEEKHLGHLFGISASHVSRISNTWILLMADRLGQINFWPSQKCKNPLLVPEKLQDKFKDLIVIVDATELFLDKPSATTAQKEMFSSYKNHVTAKAIIGIDGNGTITFHSRLYAGRTSDKKLFFHSGIVLLLKEGDLVQVDRGFDIGKELENYGVHISIPEFLRKKKQLSKEEFQSSAEVAEVRVHVERAVKKIKDFFILRDIPLTLTPMLDAIWTTCCVLANFTGSGFLVKPK